MTLRSRRGRGRRGSWQPSPDQQLSLLNEVGVQRIFSLRFIFKYKLRSTFKNPRIVLVNHEDTNTNTKRFWLIRYHTLFLKLGFSKLWPVSLYVVKINFRRLRVPQNRVLHSSSEHYRSFQFSKDS